MQECDDASIEYEFKIFPTYLIQARDTGICPARREIYAELIDELIRQVSIESPETGVLFVRIRDEINMTLSGKI